VTARIKSLSGAAQELGIPRRSLIHILRKLERQLDVPLFGWGQDWVDLTICGVIFVERVTLVLKVIEADDGRRPTWTLQPPRPAPPVRMYWIETSDSIALDAGNLTAVRRI